MKRIFSNNRIIGLAFFTVFSLATAPMTYANDSSKPVPVQLVFLGTLKNQSLFELNFTGDARENEFTIIIRDEYGNSLFRENIKAESFSKKFLVNNDELGDDSLLFYVVSKKTNKTVVYEINRQTRSEDKMVVNQLK